MDRLTVNWWRQRDLPTDAEGLDALRELALDLRSSWHHGADVIWRRLDETLWEATRNPWVVLQSASRDTVERLLADSTFRQQVDEQVRARQGAAQTKAWFQENHSQSALSCVAYFSMEFMLSEALPIYSGGLGNVAGDQLKAANDLGVPVIGVGLLYQQGYFRQLIDEHGGQEAIYPYNDPGQLPVTPLRGANGEWLRLNIDLPGHAIWLRAWQAQVGRLRLVLLDANDAANHPPYRGITAELYGGGPELRLMQEMVLGIGGWRLLTALGLEPEVCHLNEGHAAFVVLERARSYMASTGVPFDVALAVTRAGNVFTTHTAVPAGFDCFTPQQIEHCLAGYAESRLGISRERLLALGRRNANDADEPFNMAYLAIRGSAALNAVSRLHRDVSRRLFAPLFPRRPLPEVPVGYVTNGVHTPTWDSAPADALWTEACGQNRWGGTMDTLARDIGCVSDERLWQLRTEASAALTDYVRSRLSRQLAAAGASAALVNAAGSVLSRHVLTLGFARRFATYKRPNLLLHDPTRLLRLLSDEARPLQLVVAGKAHPADAAGQALIRQWVEFSRRPQARHRVVFISDYDMHVAEQLVQGVDIWINTPRRPWEASGTSGMKVLVNGGINVSELDGWWAEAYKPGVGWAIGDGQEHGDDPQWDAAEAEALYTLLENEIVPEFYDRGPDGMPHAWIARMRTSMAELTPRFSTNRAVREYTQDYYLPAAAAYRERASGNGELGAAIASWRRSLDVHWHELRFGRVDVESRDGQHAFAVDLHLGELDPEDVRVELYAAGAHGAEPVREVMQAAAGTPGERGLIRYEASVSATRAAGEFTARVLPHHAGVSVPLEAPYILWQR